MADPRSTRASEAYVLRMRGLPWAVVAREVGYKDATTARVCVIRYRKRIERERRAQIERMQSGLKFAD